MTAFDHTNPETQFNRSAWLTLALVVILLVYSIAELAYRFSLPTDGWKVNEGSDLPGFSYTKNLMGMPSGLQPGDQVIAINGVPADWQTIPTNPMIREAWQAGATLVYTVNRAGTEFQIPMTLTHWQLGKWLSTLPHDLDLLAGLFSSLVVLVLAAFVFLRRPGNPAARAFLIIMAVLAVESIRTILPKGFETWFDPIEEFLNFYIYWTLLLALLPFALLQFTLTFPHPKPIYQRYPWLPLSAGVFGVFLVIFTLGSPIGWFWFVFSFFLIVAILIHNAFTMRDAVSRAQLRWGLGGLIIGFGTLALMFLAGTSGLFAFNPDITNLIFAFAIIVMGGMLAVAILRYRLFDIDIIIRKTLVYGALTILLAIVYFGLVVLLQQIFGVLTNSEGSPIIIVVSTLTIAALFNPLRNRLQDFIDRRFYRRKYDAVQTLAQFAEAARSETDLPKLTDSLVQVVDQAMQPVQLTIQMKSGGNQKHETR